MLTESDRKSPYTCHGSFNLKVGQEMLGNIRFVEDATNGRRLYRVSDLTNALKIHRNFTMILKSKHKVFPNTRVIWADWTSIKGGLNWVSDKNSWIRDFPKKSEWIQDLLRRSKLEEPPNPVLRSQKADPARLFTVLNGFDEKSLRRALSSFNRVKIDPVGWMKKNGIDSKTVLPSDIDNLSAFDFVKLLAKANMILNTREEYEESVKKEIMTEFEKKEEKIKTSKEKSVSIPEIDVKESEGKNLSITINLNFSK